MEYFFLLKFSKYIFIKCYTSLPVVYENSSYWASSPNLGILSHLYFSLFSECVVFSHRFLINIFIMTSAIQHIFPNVYWMCTGYLCTTVCVCVCVCVLSYLTVYSPIDCSPPGFSVHGIFQARILEYVAISYSRGSSRPRDWIHITCISCIGRRTLYHECHLGSHIYGFPGGSDGKESTCNVVDLHSIPVLGRSPGGGHATHSSILA